MCMTYVCFPAATPPHPFSPKECTHIFFFSPIYVCARVRVSRCCSKQTHTSHIYMYKEKAKRKRAAATAAGAAAGVVAHTRVCYADTCHSENEENKTDKRKGRGQTRKMTTLQIRMISLSLTLVFLSVAAARLVFHVFFSQLVPRLLPLLYRCL